MLNNTSSSFKNNQQKESNLRSIFANYRPVNLKLDAVSWSPYKNKPLLKPISLSINAGEFVAVVGPNGSGKTSLLRCIYRVNKPSSGEVLIDGKNIWSIPPRQYAQRIATVLQDTGSEFGLSVFEMVEIGLTPRSTHWKRTHIDIEAINEVLILLDISHLTERDFSSLSGGERQRVLIARALIQSPDILILDEPTNHLDIRHQLELLELLSTLPCTIVVSLHDLSLASAYADRVLVMDKGEMQDYSVPQEVFTEQNIKNVFGVETIIDKHPITQRPRFSFYTKKQQD
ncbi:ABC transporter ATP-binding protein [Psychromonas sp. RZ22]|uniref:ABC transporter ATP-binding protein n=1 Tax=Psychromonas algarum TaxID=2555643 RepID=UPI001067A4C0|nr:ABC transporter ATP-binding protein [Psychromonas sp. RZ22]TEW55669.1 ABC transporter ATP-binding protein [Psychromonas sp. RZ22]